MIAIARLFLSPKPWLILAAAITPLAAVRYLLNSGSDEKSAAVDEIPGYKAMDNIPALEFGSAITDPSGLSGLRIPVSAQALFQYNVWIRDEDSYSRNNSPDRIAVFNHLIGFASTVTSGEVLARSNSFIDGKMTYAHVIRAHELPEGQTFIKYDSFTPIDLIKGSSKAHDNDGSPIAFLVEVKGSKVKPYPIYPEPSLAPVDASMPDSGRDLAEAVFRKLNQTTVICSSRKSVFSKTAAESLPTGLLEIAVRLKGATGLIHVSASEATFSWPSYPGKMVKSSYNLPRRDEEEPTTVVQGKLALLDGLASTPDGSCRLFIRNLAALKFKKPVSVHWFLKPLSVALACKDEKESALLQQIADAVGAEFSESPKEYKLGFSAAKFRKKATASYRDAEIMSTVDISREDSEFYVEGLKQFTDDQIGQAYQLETSYVQVPLSPNSEVQKLMVRRIEKEFAPSQNLLSPSRNEIRQWIKQKVDATSDSILELRPTLPPTAGLPVRGRTGAFFGF